MWCEILVPDFGMPARAKVIGLHCGCGDHLAPGTAVIDLEVDLSAGVVRDCPPASTCRIVIGEELWLRRVHVSPGSTLEPGALIAELSSDVDEAPSPASRPARTTAAAILQHPDWWNEA